MMYRLEGIPFSLFLKKICVGVGLCSTHPERIGRLERREQKIERKILEKRHLTRNF